ncbi:unnamed protein product [Staurois parvus]|uniref:Uncharacterized protein n=1 Tax=Staurois parvus TaxID=386267 RepID=A0ABN9ECM0_9NEOB|nr:unnamed protein product [Staurois parvus]
MVILTLGGNFLTSTDISSDTNTVISANKKHLHCSNDTGQEGVNIWGDQRVKCVLFHIMCCVFYKGDMLLCISLRRETCYLHTGFSPVSFTWQSLGAGGESPAGIW